MPWSVLLVLLTVLAPPMVAALPPEGHESGSARERRGQARPADPEWAQGPLRIGIGDRLTVQRDNEWVPMFAHARQAGIRPDFLQIWLTRSWRESWVPDDGLRDLDEQGITPVFVHYFFGDEISRERILNQRSEWHASLRRLGRVARRSKRALIVLEPEFNNEAPPGETATFAWPGFADEIRAALRVLRAEAPDVKIGICAGDFYPDLNLEVLDGVAEELDFFAFQEMRGSTDPTRSRAGYLRVGDGALRYARYLRARFRKPILLAYVAVSSYGGWEQHQAQALRNLAAARSALRQQGVFGVIYFQLQDDPDHVGFFGPAEREFGLIDTQGRRKPAFHVFQQLIGTRGSSARRNPKPARPR